MQRWEYLDVRVWNNEWVDSLGRGGFLKPLIHKDWGEYTVPTQVSNQLGEQGWELVSIVSSHGSDVDEAADGLRLPRADEYLLSFKRPKQESG